MTSRRRDIYFLQNADGGNTSIGVPDGDLRLAEVSPWTNFAKLGLDAAGVIELLRTYEKIPNFPVN
jgi:hypothetical protein